MEERMDEMKSSEISNFM